MVSQDQVRRVHAQCAGDLHAIHVVNLERWHVQALAQCLERRCLG